MLLLCISARLFIAYRPDQSVCYQTARMLPLVLDRWSMSHTLMFIMNSVILKMVFLLGECPIRWPVCDTCSVSQPRSAMASICRPSVWPKQGFICRKRSPRTNGNHERCDRLPLVHHKVSLWYLIISVTFFLLLLNEFNLYLNCSYNHSNFDDQQTLHVDSRAHVLHVFVNGKLVGNFCYLFIIYLFCFFFAMNIELCLYIWTGTVHGNPDGALPVFDKHIEFKEGQNDIALLSVMVGLPVRTIHLLLVSRMSMMLWTDMICALKYRSVWRTQEHILRRGWWDFDVWEFEDHKVLW